MQQGLPISDAVKHKADVVAVSGGILAWLKIVPWPELAGFLSCIYLALRICGWIWDRIRGRKTDE